MAADKKRIYIVDDDESVGRALKILLETFGFAVSTFLSAEQYFKDVPSSDHGCMLLDIHMPGLDGWETLKRIIESKVKRPVIIISADKNGGIRDRALKSGAVGYFQKPINGQELVYLINDAYQRTV